MSEDKYFNSTFIENIMDYSLFILTFTTIFLAELGDKTQIITFICSTQTRKYLFTFVSSILALTSSTLLSICLGGVLRYCIPMNIVNIIGGIIFILVGLISLKRTEKKNEFKKVFSPLSIFILIFISEIGDKTQIALLTLMLTYYSFLEIFCGAILGFILINGVAILISRKIADKISTRKFNIISSLVFTCIGIVILINYFY